MRKLRVPIVIAWIFCALISAVSLYGAASTLIRLPLADDKMLLFGDAFWSLLPMLFAIPATLIISHQPRNVIGWLLITLPLVALPVAAIDRYLQSLPAAPAPSIPILIMVTVSSLSWIALIFPILLIPLYFPTGRLLSPKWRWVIYLVASMTLVIFFYAIFSRQFWSENLSWTLENPYGFIPNEAETIFMPVWSWLLIFVTVFSLVSIFVRFRRASIVEREQIKWLLSSCALFGMVYIPSVLIDAGTDRINSNPFFILLFALTIIAIPVSITIAILRYHLFDIDVIIRLTLVYATVTALMGLVYAGGVALLQEILRSLTGQTSELAVLITTLAIAALFNPLRQRVQEMINRRFYRQKYNADQALTEFASAARSGSDLDALSGMLTDLVAKTLEPVQVTLFMKVRKTEAREDR